MQQANADEIRRDRSQLSLALWYARRGFPVFPVNPWNKRPYCLHGFHDATCDEAIIETWWRRWLAALVGIPTGPRSGYWVLDVDGEAGSASLEEILAALGIQRLEGLTAVIVRTPSGGLHLYFRCGPGEEVRTRASDIAPGIDTRGLGGYIIAAGNRRPDGRSYDLIGTAAEISEASFAPRDLVFLGTFNRREREQIVSQPKLRSRMCDATPSEWPGIMRAYRDAEAERLQAQRPPSSPDALRRQALHDLHEAADEYASRLDGRRNGLFTVACRIARYPAHGVISEHEFRSALLQAACSNGAVASHGDAWFNDTLRRALAYGARDALPPVARRFILESAA
ncbi:bifunctional DNA primase/polymerase [Hyphomicrobium sp. CS1BSMeth3]|uniref:bifunctional DNA primase/polymerase n=1 Tax=Hyphomicrobium sp. CS1BSMeth3 TaxID=1892844 RepID=UPI00092FF24A|nr:bifunctional DNA primase/polymerase [Hyphomicrobium sp. CS1BSMeth3]